MTGAGDTIFAVASGAGKAAVTLIRITGPDSGMLVSRLCGRLPTPRRAALRTLRDQDGEVLDRGIVVWMPGPASYTGENTAELSLHGGEAVLSAVSSTLLAAGARPAEPGEFTRRAFLAGRMDLLEAEAVGDLVAAETDAQRRQALRQLEGVPSRLVAGWASRLRTALAHQEALIDFPDEGLPADVEHALANDLQNLVGDMEQHTDAAAKGAKLRQGLVIAVVGAPNAGKSSLVNLLAGRDMAIVSPIAGTTRDTLEAIVEIEGVKVTLVDTAGLREARDEIEAEGVRRALARAAGADLVLRVFDAREPAPTCDVGDLLVANKIDLVAPPDGVVGISVLYGEGLEHLRTTLSGHVKQLAHPGSGPVLSSARHAASLRDARSAIAAALVQPAAELRAEELRLAMSALGRITGRIDAEAVLDTIFMSFCIGK